MDFLDLEDEELELEYENAPGTDDEAAAGAFPNVGAVLGNREVAGAALVVEAPPMPKAVAEGPGLGLKANPVVNEGGAVEVEENENGAGAELEPSENPADGVLVDGC